MDLFSIAGKIILDDGGVSAKLDSVNSKARSTGSTFDEAFGKIKGAALKLGGVLLGGMGLKEVFDEANESQFALTQMNTVLQSTHDASGMTKQGLESLAESTGRVTEFSKAETEQGENLMLTFTRIGKEVFPGAMEASENMATAMHMDLSSAVLQVGKALGNLSLNSKGGVQGLTMLQREGVNFSDAEKKQIAIMLQHNDVAGAQKVVLQELQTEFGNSAKAAGQTFGGQLKILKNNLLDVGAGIMEKLMPPIQNAVSFINSHMPQIQSAITGVINHVTPVVQGLFRTIQSHMPQIQQLVSHVVSTVSSMVQTIKPFIQPIITDIITIAGNLLPNLSSSASGTSSVFSGVLKTALSGVKNILDWMATHGAAVKVAILGIGGAFATFKTVSAVTGTISKIKSGFDKVTKAAGKVKGKIGDVSTALSLVKDIKKPSDFFALINSSGKMDGFNSKIGKVGSAFGSLGSKVAGLGSKMGGVLLNGLKKVGSGFKSLFALMAANPISIVIVAIVALVAALVVLYNKNKAFRNLVNNVWNGIKTFFAGLPAFFSGLWSSITSAATNFWNSIVGFFTQSIPAFIDSVGQWFQKLPYNIGYALGTAVKAVIDFGTSLWGWVTGTLPQIIQGIIQWFSQLPGRIWAALLQAIDKVKQWGSNMWNYLSVQIPKIINGIIKWFGQLPGKIWVFLSRVVSDIGRWGSQTYSSAVSAASNTINAISTWFSQLPGRIWNFLTTTINNIGTWGGNMLQAAGQAAQNTVNGIINWFQQLPGKMLDIGKNIITGLWNGITGAAGWLRGKITGFCGNIVKGFKDALKIHSPSQVFADEIGKFMALGIGQGFTDNMQSVSDKMTAAVGAATSGLSVGVKAQLQPAYAGNVVPTTAETVKAAVKGGNVIFNNNFYEKTSSQSEVTRQQKNMLRQLSLGFNLG